MEMRPQSIFAKVMSPFHKNILQPDRFLCPVIDFLFYATKWTAPNGKALSSSLSLLPFYTSIRKMSRYSFFKGLNCNRISLKERLSSPGVFFFFYQYCIVS